MKRLKLKSLKVISTATKKAKIIDFGDKLTIITSNSENRTGKSLMTKAIYYALGADLSQYVSDWQNLSIVTILDFEYNNSLYTMFRLKNNIILHNCVTNAIQIFKSLKELKDFYNEFFDMKLKLSLTINNDDNLHIPYAQALFMPFYIDQDQGWSNMWNSFKSIGIYKDGKKEILEFYTGVKTNDYYKLKNEKTNKEKIIKEIKVEQANCKLVIDTNLKHFNNIVAVNANIKEFKENIDALMQELNKVQKNKNTIKAELLSVYNKKNEILDELQNVKSVLKDLEKDKAYMLENFCSDVIVCPTCGVVHENNSQVRYVVELDIENCQNNIETLLSKLDRQDAEIKKLKRKLDISNSTEKNISNILNKRKNKVKLNDILLSEGINSVIKNLQKKLRIIDKQLFTNEQDLEQINSELKYYDEIQREQNKIFINLIKPFLATLGIGDIAPKKIGEKIKEGGSDQARCIMAYVLAYYIMASENKDAVLFPLVIDTPAQQEPNVKDMQTLYNLILNKLPEDAQLIITTSDLYGMKFQGTIHTFTNKRAVLNVKDYNIVEKCYMKYLQLLTEVDE